MKFLATLLLSLLTSFSLFSQSTVTGIVQDDENNAIPFATVIAYNAADSSMAKGEITANDGSFTIGGLENGRYWIKITSVGYSTFISPLFELNGYPYQVKNIKMSQSAVGLEAVEVKQQRPIIQMLPDKTVFNVQGSINATGNDALELLRKSPGVVVDNNDNIMLSGKSGVKVYINGKPTYLSSEDLAAYLKSLQSTQIDNIEIITNPSAKYEAEGNAGIINIVLIKDKSIGTNGNINFGYGIGTFAKYNLSASLNHRTKKVNIFGTYSLFTGNFRNWMNIYNEQAGLEIEKTSVNIWSPLNHSARAGMDYYIDEKNTIGILFSGYNNDFTSIGQSTAEFKDKETGTVTSILDADTENEGLRQNINTNLNYAFKGANNITWNVDLDYGTFRNERENYQPNYYLDPATGAILNSVIYTSYAPTDIDIYVAKADHERPFLKGQLGAGVKSSFVTTDNAYDFYNVINGEEILDQSRSNDFVLTENINAAYATYNRKIDEISLNAGLRVEHTHSLGELTSFVVTENNKVERDYVDYFPSGGVSWQPSKAHQWSVNYSRRINRPDYQDLNPFEWKMNEISFMRGNPFLKPQYANVVSLSHSYKYMLNTSISYTYTKDFFARITDSVDVNKGYLEPVNLDYQKVISLSVNSPFRPTKWWNTYTNLTVFNQANYAENVNGRNVDVSITTFSAYHQSSFMLPKDFTFQVSGWFNSPSVWSGVMKTDANYSIDLGLQKKLFNNKATAKVSFSDIFNTASWRAVQEFPGYYADVVGGWESRRLSLNFSYIFGNQEVKKSRNRKTGLDSEMDRVKDQDQ